MIPLYRNLISYLSKYKWRIILSCLCSVFEAIFELTIPLVLAVMLDDGIASGNIAYTLELGGAMLLLAVLVFSCGILSVRLATTAGTGFSADLRQAQFSHIQRFSFRNIEHFGSASLITRMTGDVTAVQTAVFQCVKQAVRASSMVIVAAIMSVRLSRQLSAMFLVLVPLMVLFVVFLILRTQPLYRDMQSSVDALNLTTQENLTNIRTVKAYVRGESQKQQFRTVNDNVFRTADRAYGLTSFCTPVVTLLTYISMLILLGYGGRLVMNGSATIGELAGFITYISQIFAQLMSLANSILLLNRSIISGKRINEVLDEQPEILSGTDADTVKDSSICFDHVSFAYNDTGNVLEDISFSAASGQTIGIVGGTGSSKSTLVQLIPRLYEVTEGSISVGGEDIRRYPLEVLRSDVAIVLQTNTLFSGTIRENLLWGNPDATDDQLDAACRIACADEFISRFPDGYETKIGQDGVNVSGGQRQRLCLARAILQNPKVLILDDSTSAVDMTTEAKILDAFRHEIAGTTKIIIAQRIRTIKNADLILVIDNGRISAMGTHEELMVSSEIYRQTCISQHEGGSAE